ncbi:DUF4466 family protein [Dyadobacter sp. CY343]|uniref:DUF4466 family protein n=1 Tax=Dyadobacter sp. CY343 TaxID=2907299 RepID=UPI001F17D43C|nr:DUF4466 family protein [Dyadobacter sp. CY343]MCE7059730.1 DUF4466 family protein [Dyadobacter sp. CY343]
MRKVWNLRDLYLVRLQLGVYITIYIFSNSNPTVLLIARVICAEAGMRVGTQDGKYRAYVYVNSLNNNTRSAKISIKRFMMK